MRWNKTRISIPCHRKWAFEVLLQGFPISTQPLRVLVSWKSLFVCWWIYCFPAAKLEDEGLFSSSVHSRYHENQRKINKKKLMKLFQNWSRDTFSFISVNIVKYGSVIIECSIPFLCLESSYCIISFHLFFHESYLKISNMISRVLIFFMSASLKCTKSNFIDSWEINISIAAFQMH